MLLFFKKEGLSCFYPRSRTTPIPLRTRLVAAIVLALLLSFAAGAGLAAWQAARSVRTELTAALDGARASAAAAMPDAGELARIVASFDGNRHIRAALHDASGRIVAASTPAAAGAAPRWFLTAISPTLAPVKLRAGSFALVLSADAANEGFERWSELRETVAVLALFCAVAAGVCSLTATHALRPLGGLSAGFARLASGARDVRVPQAGPPEVAALTASFNTLAAALQTARDHNLDLQTQANLLAEEERTEIARDLHDEIGPLLFAITAFTATIGRLAAEGDVSGIAPQLRAIQDATSAIQSEVRDMLGRLHDVTPQAASLADMLENLAAFWRKVQPDMVFTLHMDAASQALCGRPGETLFRVAQESVSNAVRHGRPRHVAISAGQTDGQAVLSVRDDGQGGPALPGYGLTGMRARVAACGGRLTIGHGAGWTVTASLPLAGAA